MRLRGTLVRSILGASVVGASVVAVVGCTRPPVSPPPAEGEGDGVTAIDLPTFLQDRPAIGGKWYEYNVDGHLLEPKPESFIVDDGHGEGAARFHAFRIVSVYDDNTGDTGVFHLEVAHRTVVGGDAGWSDAIPFDSQTNIKDGAPVCLTLSTLTESSCDAAGWDLRFVLQSRLSVFAGFAVAEPAVFLADAARVARVDGQVALVDLPDPTTLPTLDDGEAAVDSTDWDFGAFAPDLPQRGRVLGALDRVVDQTWTMVDGGRGLVEFSVAAVDDNTLRFSLRRQPIAIEDFTAPDDLGELRDVDVDLTTLPVFLSLREDDLLSLDEKLASSSWPTQPPFARDYDIVIDADADGSPTLLLSPATAAKLLP